MESNDRIERTATGGSTTRRRGPSTDGRPYVMVLAVAPWTSLSSGTAAPSATTPAAHSG